MRKSLDISGYRFGKLTAIKLAANINNPEEYWVCKCDCGNITTVRKNNLTRGRTKSCGCLRLAGFKHADNRNSSGVVGVSFDKTSNKWRASLTVKGHDILSRRFKNFNEAVKARKSAEKEYLSSIRKG